MTELYHYDRGYPYLNHLLEKTGRFSYDLRTAFRSYIRIYVPLELSTGSRILDIGSCRGTLGHYLKYGGINTYGIDLNIHAIKAGRNVFGIEKANNSAVGNAVLLLKYICVSQIYC